MTTPEKVREVNATMQALTQIFDVAHALLCEQLPHDTHGRQQCIHALFWSKQLAMIEATELTTRGK